MICGVIKSEWLISCNKLKIQPKYESEKVHSGQEMRTSCEAFEFTKIEAPSAKANRAHKKANGRLKISSKPNALPQNIL